MNMVGRIAEPQAAEVAALPRVPLGWRPALVVLGLGLLAWGLLFSEEIASAVRVWDASTAYNHCWLIAPISGWLFWQRRQRLEGLAPSPTPLFALLAIPGALAWLAAERLGIMEGRQLVAFGLAQVLVLSVLGWPFVRAFIGPLSYLVFLVPFGAFAIPVLQMITARFIDIGLDLLGITHFTDGMLIETPAGLFHVAEACAGLRFSIAALAFGALYALVIFRSLWRRLIVLAVAIVLPVIANGIRATSIIVLAEYLGSAEAAAADHIYYGLAFFAVALLLLILAGLPFREDSAPPAALPIRIPKRPARTISLVVAGTLAVTLVATGPAVAAGIAYHAGAPVEMTTRLAAPEGCTTFADGTTLDCGGLQINAKVFKFSPRVSWSAVSSIRWRIAGGTDTDLTFGVPIPGGGTWQGRQAFGEARATAFATWLDGRPVGHGLATRLAQARNSLFGGGGNPVLVVVSLRVAPSANQPEEPQSVRALLIATLIAQGDTLAADAAVRSRGR